MNSAVPSKTFATYYNDTFKPSYARKLEEHPTHHAKIDVPIETTLNQDNVRIQTTADIVLYNTSHPLTVTDFIVADTFSINPPSTLDIAHMYAHIHGLQTTTQTPTGRLVVVALKSGGAAHIDIQFNQGLWDNLYKLVLIDSNEDT